MAHQIDESKPKYLSQTRFMSGRRIIKTSVTEITDENVVDVLRKALATHDLNRSEIDYLWKYYRGDQPIRNRVKDVRPEICNKITENRANEIVSFKVGYLCGEPIQYVSRNGGEEIVKQINTLNEYMFAEDKAAQDQELVEWQMICGTAFRLVLPDEPGEEDEAPFELYTLDPRDTFVVYSNEIGNKPLMAVKYSKDDNEIFHYSIYTENHYYLVDGDILVESKPHALDMIPIIEYPGNNARLGSFEIVLPLLDAINNVESNRMDGMEQLVQAFIKFINCDITKEEYEEFLQLGAIKVKSVDGQAADVGVVTTELNQTQSQTLKDDYYNAMLTICGMPNDSVMSSALDSYVSPIGADVPQFDFSVTLKNYDHYFNMDNPNSAINYLETGQEMDIMYGYQTPGSDTIEWIQGNHLWCSEWESDDNTATIRCQDIFRNMDGEYVKGLYSAAGKSYYALAEEILKDAGISKYYIDPRLKKLYSNNPIPRVKYKEALQIIANACRCVLTQSRDGKVQIKSNFMPSASIATNGEETYSNAANVLTDTPKVEYATLAGNYTPTDGTMFFLSRNGKAALTTGYVSKEISGANETFTKNPVVTITMEAIRAYYGLKLVFGTALPAAFTIRTYKGGEPVNEYPVEKDEINTTSIILRDFDDFDVMKIEFTKTAEPYNRIVLNYFSLSDVVDFTMNRRDMTSSPKAIKQELIKEVMNEALNYIMSMLENGTNLYEEFQTYCTTQKELFKSSGDSSYQELTQYFVNLKAQGDSSLAQIEKTYEEHMTTYEGEQTAAFNTWFAGIKGKLNEDIAGSLQNQITEVDERLAALEHMTLKNLFTVPVAINNTGTTLLADDLGNANTTAGGYVGSDMYKSNLEQAKTTIKSAFSGHVLKHRIYLTNAVANGRASGGAWCDSEVDLMCEQMVYGSGIFSPVSDGSNVPVNYRVEKSQLPLFQHEPSRIGNRNDWWLRDVITASDFALVGDDGLADYYGASDSLGVRPAFCIS